MRVVVATTSLDGFPEPCQLAPERQEGREWQEKPGRIGATQSEVTASHSVYVSQPEAVATLIAQAAAAATDR